MKEQRILQLFEEIGLTVHLEQVDLKLPLAHQARFSWLRMRLESSGENYLLIQEKRRGSLNSLLNQANMMAKKAGNSYILCFTSLSPEVRKLLIKHHIPFIDYSGNMFLPMLSLKTVASVKEPQLAKPFTKNEQQILLQILLLKKEYFSYKDLVVQHGFAQTTTFRALNKFRQMEWLQTQNELYFLKKSRQSIFEDARSFLFNPVEKVVYLDQIAFKTVTNMLGTKTSSAGLSALAHYSFIAADEQVLAIPTKQLNTLDQKWLNKETSKIKFPQTIELQLWKYSSKMGDYVDPLSLYLSFEGEEDPRIQQALDKLLLECLGENQFASQL